MTVNMPYCSVSDICASHQLTKDDFIDVFLRKNLKLCVYLTGLKTYYFDFTLIDYKLKQYHVCSSFESGLFYLTAYEACKVLSQGESLISRIKPAGEMFITLAHPQKIMFEDLLVDTQGMQLFQPLLQSRGKGAASAV